MGYCQESWMKAGGIGGTSASAMEQGAPSSSSSRPHDSASTTGWATPVVHARRFRLIGSGRLAPLLLLARATPTRVAGPGLVGRAFRCRCASPAMSPGVRTGTPNRLPLARRSRVDAPTSTPAAASRVSGGIPTAPSDNAQPGIPLIPYHNPNKKNQNLP